VGGHWPPQQPSWARARQLPPLDGGHTSGAISTGSPTNSPPTEAATMPPYSWVGRMCRVPTFRRCAFLASARIRSVHSEPLSAGTALRLQRRRRRRSSVSKFAWTSMGCSGVSSRGPVIAPGQEPVRRASFLRCDERPVVDPNNTCQISQTARQRVGIPLVDVVEPVTAGRASPVERQRVCHHRRVERIVRESCITGVFSLRWRSR